MKILQEFNSVYGVMFLVSLFGIILSVVWTFRNKRSWQYILTPFLFFLNTFLYTTALWLNLLTHSGNELWEGIIILHALLLFILMLFTMPLKMPINSGGK